MLVRESFHDDASDRIRPAVDEVGAAYAEDALDHFSKPHLPIGFRRRLGGEAVLVREVPDYDVGDRARPAVDEVGAVVANDALDLLDEVPEYFGGVRTTCFLIYRPVLLHFRSPMHEDALTVQGELTL